MQPQVYIPGLSPSRAAGTYVPYTGATGNLNLGTHGLTIGSNGVINNTYLQFSNGYGMFTGGNNFLLYTDRFVMNKKLFNEDTVASDWAGDIRGQDFVNRRAKTITRNAAGFITQVAMTGGRTVTMTRDANNYITSKTDATNTWSFVRNASNQVTAIAVA